MKKINFRNGQAPYINDTNLNRIQDNIEEAINELDPSIIESEATEVNDEDLFLVLQNGVKKKVSASKVKGQGGATETINVADNLESDSATDALSAKQGKVLKEKIEQRTGCITACANIYNFSGTIAAFGTLKISLNTAIKNTEKLELTEDGGIKIKSGISKIKVSGQCAVYRGKTGGYGVRILKNNDIVASGDGSFSDWQVSSYTITNRIIEVAENDVIYLYMKSNSDAESNVSLTDASKYLWLTVEVVE